MDILEDNGSVCYTHPAFSLLTLISCWCLSRLRNREPEARKPLMSLEVNLWGTQGERRVKYGSAVANVDYLAQK